ncbi:MAG: M23 family metallopeptidase [Bacteroidetes bacterium]|nr:M23 family metallopeptidase [Bacteroidota bacterium]
MAVKKEDKKNKWYYKLRNKYRLVIMNDITFEERLSFRLTRLNVFVTLGTTITLLIALTTLLISLTPLREYIPGYTDVQLFQRVYELQNKTDSLERIFAQKDLYFRNIKSIVEGNPIMDMVIDTTTHNLNYDTIALTRSVEDSLLRADYENQNKFDLYFNDNEALYDDNNIRNFTFFSPLKGVITTNFSLVENHFGVDIVSKEKENIKAVLDGAVIFSEWTVETGYVIAVQHQQNFISFYKHNSALLKKAGNYVKAGDPIAIIGDSGELSTGPHLHFELWRNGSPVNPLDYMTF